MLRRLAVLLVPAAVAVPLLAAPASASCRSDLMATNFGEGYERPPYSPHWAGPGYVTVRGTATVTVDGDTLLADAQMFPGEVENLATVLATNTAEATVTFVDCVAG